MHTITRRNKWRTLSESELGLEMPWMKVTHRSRMSKAVFVLIMFGVPIVVFPVLHILDNTLNEYLKNIWISVIAAFFAFAAIYLIVDYNRKMKCFIKGDFQAVNVTIASKAYSNSYRNHFYYVTVTGLYSDDKPVKKKFKISGWIYKRVSEGDRAFVIKYNYKKTKDPFADLDLLPAKEF